MDTHQITEILERSLVTSSSFVGCFPADRIPNYTALYPHCMVANTHGAKLPGEHWVAFYVEGPNSPVEYYDSLGDWPPTSSEISQHLAECFEQVVHLAFPLQSPFSDACGHHVIYFLYHRCKGRSFGDIVARLTRNLKLRPDTVVRSFVRQKFGHK